MTMTTRYKSIEISRNVESGYKLRWSAYVIDRFVSADTLQGIKSLISATLTLTQANKGV